MFNFFRRKSEQEKKQEQGLKLAALAYYIVQEAGENEVIATPTKPAHLESIRRYQGNGLTIIRHGNWLLDRIEVLYQDRPVLEAAHEDLQRFNAGQTWIEALHNLYERIKAERDREYESRFADLEE